VPPPAPLPTMMTSKRLSMPAPFPKSRAFFGEDHTIKPTFERKRRSPRRDQAR
jgi:hypothetical protein